MAAVLLHFRWYKKSGSSDEVRIGVVMSGILGYCHSTS